MQKLQSKHIYTPLFTRMSDAIGANWQAKLRRAKNSHGFMKG
jgi:hypothetical protein